MLRYVSFRSSSSTVEEKKQDEEPAEDMPVLPQDDILATVQREEWYQQSLTVLVMGASGDLAKKKTYPALLELYWRNLLPVRTVVWGFARTKKTHEELRAHIRPHLLKQASEEKVDGFLKHCFYQPGKTYGDWRTLQEIVQRMETDNILVYLAIPPHVFGETTHALKMALKANKGTGFVRVILEKPFGNDTESCQSLLDTLKRQKWSEEQLYRIDHYLGKEMVQNVLTLRQYNPWLQAMWNRQTVQSVHIIFKEPFGTEGRGGYFDPYGIIRDILQNHLMQVLSLIAMEIPEKMSSEEIRDAKVNVLKSMPIIRLEDCLLGQYDGYKDDPTIENKETVSPTYACVRTFVRTATWEGVPFVLEAGKALDERLCEVRLHLKGEQHNALVLRLQPKPALFLTANLKTPGFSQVPVSTHMGVDYGLLNAIPEAYTRLLLDALRGQQANFVRDDELLQAWHIFTPVLHQIDRDQVRPEPYAKGTNGPENRADFLVGKNVRQVWLPPPSAL